MMGVDMVRRKTHEEYVKELSIKNPNIEVVGRYINSTTKVTHRCLKDGFEWDVLPTAILRGHGCPQCNGGVKMIHDEYVEKLRIKNPSIIVIGQYKNSQTKITHRCLIDGHEWLLSPGNALSGRGCPICGGTMKKSHERYVNEIKIKNPSVIVIGEYINNATKIKHKCLACNYEWNITPNDILSGNGCPICAIEKLRNKFKKSHEKYVCELSCVNKNIIVLEEYINARVPIKHKCLIDGWEWYASPGSLLRGHGCPQCNKCSKSIGERIVAEWLDNHDINYKKQKTFNDCKDKHCLQFDFYLPDYNLIIEYNGKQHYEPIDYFGGQEGFEYTIKHDNIKSDYCKKNNISLFTIPYFKDVYEELENIYDFIKNN